MKRLLIIALVVLPVLVAAVVVAAVLGADHVASNVILPRVERRLGAEVTYQEVNPGLGNVEIVGVEVSIPDVPEAEVSVASVRARYELWPLLRGQVVVREILFDSPRFAVRASDDGSLRRVGEYLRGIRRGRGDPAEGGGGAGRPTIRVVDGEVALDDPRGVSLHADGVGGALEDTGAYEIHAERGHLRAQSDGPDLVAVGGARASGDIRGGELAIDEAEVDRPAVRLSVGRRAEELRATGRALRRALSELRGSAEEPTDGSGADRPPAPAERLGLGATVRVTEGRVDLFRQDAEVPALALAGLEGQLFAGTASEPPSLSLSGRADPGGGTVRFGVTVSEAGPRVHAEMASFRVGDFAEDLSRRGVAFDEASLVDADLWVTLQDGHVRFRGEVSTDRLTVEGRLLASEPLRDLRFRLLGSGSFPLSGRALVLDDARVWVNGVEVGLSGRASRADDHYELDFTAELHPVGCAQLLEATPEPLREEIDELELQGTISGRVRVAVDSRRFADTVLDVNVRNGCTATGHGSLAISRLEERFVQRVALPEEEIFEFETGPGSAAWASLSRISPYMVAAVLTTEDGRFWSHNGFSVREIRRALVRDLEAGSPRFGASTITMQLARNLYLFRGRTLARKLQEAVLTWYIEQHLSKDQILALYLNVIEFGPHLFGIGRATMHYFGRPADDLSPREAVFLAKLLPSPVRRHESTYERGELSPRWRNMLDRTLSVMRERRHISAEELRAAREDRIIFHDPDSPLPARRFWRPSALRRRDGFDVVLDPWDDGGDEGEGGEQDGVARIPAPPQLLD